MKIAGMIFSNFLKTIINLMRNYCKKFINVPGTAWEKVRRLTNVDFILKFSGSNLVTFLIIFKTPIMAPHAVAALGGMQSPIREKSNSQRLKLSPPKFRQM